MGVVGPAIALDAVVLEVLQGRNSELAALGDDLGVGIVLHALADLVLGKLHELVDEHVLQLVLLSLILLVNLGERHLILLLRLTGLDGTREELLVDDHTAERRIGLQGRILHVAGLVAEDGAKQLLLR